MQKKYNNFEIYGGISKNNRRLLDLLNLKLKKPFKIDDAVKILEISYTKTSRLLAYWASRGWLSRIRKGLYITVPLGAVNPAERKEDPWIIASNVFSPCYVGGWSACEHWGLTDQIFKDIVVFTSNKVRNKKMIIQDTVYIIKSIQDIKIFGTNNVWRQQIKVKVSDPSRTIVDILNDPSIGGGMRHIIDIIRQYFNSKHKDNIKLLSYIKQINNRTIYKRLGYIIELLNFDLPSVIEICKSNISKGYSVLDPTISKKGNIVRRWNLRVNISTEINK